MTSDFKEFISALRSWIDIGLSFFYLSNTSVIVDDKFTTASTFGFNSFL